MLLDRHFEREELDRALATAREGSSAVLVLRGEPGVGKTALLDYAVDAAGGLAVVRLVGIESERELASPPCTSSCGRSSNAWMPSPVPVPGIGYRLRPS